MAHRTTQHHLAPRARIAHRAAIATAIAPAIVTALLTAMMVATLAGCHSGTADNHAENHADNAAIQPMLVRRGANLVVPAQSPLRERLRVAVVEGAAGAHAVTLPAVVEADAARSVSIVPPLAGRLLELKVKLGDTVKQGQVLAVISSPDLAMAQADAVKARDVRELAQRALQRSRGVNAAGANADKDMELAESAYIQAAAEATRADARLRSLGDRGIDSARHRAAPSSASSSASSSPTAPIPAPSALVLTAPVSGTVTALNSGTGAWLNDPAAPLMVIANLEQVWISAQVPEGLIASIAKGQSANATLSAWPGQQWHGSIASVSPVLDADTHRARARIAFANADGKLKPNMYANVSVAVAATGQVSVPASALLMNNDSTTVMVEVAPWTFTRRVVVTGAEDGERVRIVSGLAVGERVVVRGGVLLND